MTRTLRIICLAIIFSAIFFSGFGNTSASAADQHEKHPLRKLDLPVQDWITQGEHTDFPWKVEISKPVLNYEQRILVKVTAAVRADKLQEQSVTRDLHFIVKMADESGKWTTTESYTPFPIVQKMDRHSDVQMETEMYIQPGKYRIATIVYDSVLKQRNLAFNKVEINAVPHDPLPELQKNLPQVEYLPGSSEGDDLFGEEHVTLPVATLRPVQLDIIIDTGKYEDAEDRTTGPIDTDQYGRRLPRRLGRFPVAAPVKDSVYLTRLLQSAAVLSGIKPSDGCVRVTALDPLKRRMIFAPTQVNKLDWETWREKLLAKDGDLVNVADYAGRREAPKFFQEQLESVMAEPGECRSAARIILVLSNGKHFADKTTKPRVDPHRCAGKCEIFYLHQEGREEHDSDELKIMLSAATILDAKDPAQFRQKLADLIKMIERQ
ncbi:MAG: hypothetical protein JWO13_256 [Acidobacteriales bacterium]|nr:hypothetical protein [Terriglobales bacterium]